MMDRQYFKNKTKILLALLPSTISGKTFFTNAGRPRDDSSFAVPWHTLS